VNNAERPFEDPKERVVEKDGKETSGA